MPGPDCPTCFAEVEADQGSLGTRWAGSPLIDARQAGDLYAGTNVAGEGHRIMRGRPRHNQAPKLFSSLTAHAALGMLAPITQAVGAYNPAAQFNTQLSLNST
jgi:hypothetical protein